MEQALAFFLEHDYPKMLAILQEEGFFKEALVTTEEMGTPCWCEALQRGHGLFEKLAPPNLEEVGR